MLKLWLYQQNKDYIHSAGLIFDAEYEPEWLEEPLIKEMIRDVDDSEVISGELIQSPVFGAMPPERLSGGVKTLIMASHDPTRIYNLTSCGDNCAKWIIYLAENRDITMRLGHIMHFSQMPEFRVQLLKTGEIVTDVEDFINKVIDAEIVFYHEDD